MKVAIFINFFYVYDGFKPLFANIKFKLLLIVTNQSSNITEILVTQKKCFCLFILLAVNRVSDVSRIC